MAARPPQVTLPPTPAGRAPPAPASTVLEAAAAIVDGDRERTYGDPGRNLRTIAALWTAWLTARGWTGPALDLADSALMLALLKLARLAADPTHRDSLIDLAGYARVLERAQAAGPGTANPNPTTENPNVGNPTKNRPPQPRGGRAKRHGR